MDSSACAAQPAIPSSRNQCKLLLRHLFFLLFLCHRAENQKIPFKKCTYETGWLTGSTNNRCTWVLTTFLAPSNNCRLQWRSCSLPNTFSHFSLASSQIIPQESFQLRNPIKTNLAPWQWWICPLTNLIICLLALWRAGSDSFRFIHTFSVFC